MEHQVKLPEKCMPVIHYIVFQVFKVLLKSHKIQLMVLFVALHQLLHQDIFCNFLDFIQNLKKIFITNFPLSTDSPTPPGFPIVGGIGGAPSSFNSFQNPPHKNRCAPSVKQPMNHFHEMIPRKTTNLAKILEKYV